RVFDVERQTTLMDLGESGKLVRRLKFTADGKRLIAVTSNSLTVYHTDLHQAALAGRALEARRGVEGRVEAAFEDHIILERTLAALRADPELSPESLPVALALAEERVGPVEDGYWRGNKVVDMARALVDPDREDKETDVALGLALARLWVRRQPFDEDFQQILTWARLANGLDNEEHYEGDGREPEPSLRKALEAKRRTLGDGHPDTLTVIKDLGLLLQKRSKLDEAEPLLREALVGFRRTLGDDNADTQTLVDKLGALLIKQDNHAEAEPLLRESLAFKRQALGNAESDWRPLYDVQQATLMLGQVLKNLGKLDEAESLLREASLRAVGKTDMQSILLVYELGSVLWKQGKLDEAEPIYRETLEKVRSKAGIKNSFTLGFAHSLAILLKELGKLEEAETLTRETIEFTKQDSPDLAKRKALLEEVLALQADAADKPADQTRESDDG
ncbi:MAG TPA: tetratricopeptide repeat protein, partial [Planctomycetota bacterium]|nr:tetratricopeptide repeat protein [Planctomycetota bacterium]